LLLPGVKLQVKFTKTKNGFTFRLPKTIREPSQIFGFGIISQKSEASPPTILLAHMNSLDKVTARYFVPRMILKTFAFSSESQSLSQDIVVLEPSRTAYFSRGATDSILWAR
jgi:hypothetical protein